MSTYHTIITNAGKQLFANAINSSNKVNISHLSLGDGNGNMSTPNATRTRLVNERTKVAVNDVKINASNANWLEVSAIIPSNNGGYTVREIGLYAGNTLVAIGNFPATYKPSANEGGAREMSIKVVIALENASVVNVSLDNSLVYATQKWVEQNFVNHNEVVNNLTSTDTTKPLSANMGRSLQGQIDTLDNKKLGKTDNAVSSSKLATPRTIALTGDVSGQTSFDGSANVGIGVTLANSGVQAGTYQSVTVDAKGRVTNGQTVLNSLITATTTTGTTNQATGNTNTYLNLVTRTGTSTHSQGSSTKITGTNGISVSSDTAGALTIAGTRASDTAVGVTQLSHNTNGTDKTKAASEFALGEVRRMANQAQVTADGIALTWGNVQNKPSTFTPSTHRHNWSEIDGKPSTYPPAMHSHAWGEITGKPSTFTPSTHSHAWNDITGKPATFTPTEHTHNDKANLSGDNFTGKITAPYLELGALGNIPYPSISFNSNRTGSRYWSAEPSLQEFHVISRSGNGVLNGQIVYKFINRVGGVYTVATTEDNVASATKLQTPRTINGVAFDGTRDIVVSDSTKLGKTENAASASKLATPRNIALTGAVTGSVSFDGSQNVSITTNFADEYSIQARAYCNAKLDEINNPRFRKNKGFRSVQSQGNGVFRFTFSTNAPDSNYIVNATCSKAWHGASSANIIAQTNSYIDVQFIFGGDNTTGIFNPETMCLTVFY